MATVVEQGHRFGGVWTELKLEAVCYYLGFFTKVLERQPFDLWYIDAFAGSGTREETRERGGLFDGAPIETAVETLAGSVLHALAVEPPFSRHVFIEGKRARFRELEAIAAEHPEKRIECRHGDANEQLRAILTAEPWSNPRGRQRAVIFLDPYGMNVAWETLALLAATRRVDVWYLFPLQAVTRQLAGDLGKVDARKQSSLDGIFGTPDWRSELYATETVPDLFSLGTTSSTRNVSQREIEEYSRKRLGMLFRYVSPPLPLMAEGRGHLFSLFCLSNSGSDAAIGLIQKGVTATLKKYGAASRPRLFA